MTTFPEWLATQTARRDPVGALARRSTGPGGGESFMAREMADREKASVVASAMTEWKERLRSSSPSGASRSGASGEPRLSPPAPPAPRAKPAARATPPKDYKPCPCSCGRSILGPAPTGADLERLRAAHDKRDTQNRTANTATGLSANVRTARSR